MSDNDGSRLLIARAEPVEQHAPRVLACGGSELEVAFTQSRRTSARVFPAYVSYRMATLNAAPVSPQVDVKTGAESIALVLANFSEPETALPQHVAVRSFRHQHNLFTAGG